VEGLHSHCTIGLPALTNLTAAELGTEVLQVACEALADGTSLPNAQRLVAGGG
jgi:oxaloacetate decarboxylase alpha subunit